MARRKIEGMNRDIIIPVGDVARVLGWSRDRTKRWLTNHNIQRISKSGRWYTTRALIRSAFPEDADYIIASVND
jgi:hypothetical protein